MGGMCQLPVPRMRRVSLLSAFVLVLPLLASAADAGLEQDAGVPEEGNDAGLDAGAASDLQLLFPPLGTTDVVIHPSFLLRVERAALDQLFYGSPKSVTRACSTVAA
jgi:hypothetical protein